MDSLGRTNPLARFLTGRTVSLGQQLELPNDVAEKLLGLGDEFGRVSQFTLRLDDIRDVHGATCAVFHASIDAASTNSTQMRLQVEGPLVVEVDTCRAVHASFIGPIGMSETRGSLSATYQMTATGRMQVDIASSYRDVE
jgi:ribosomal protein L31